MWDEITEQTTKFNAQFKEERPVRKGFAARVAFAINEPHEDNHRRTPMTEVLIEELIAMGDQFIINKAMVQNIHHALFSGELESPGIIPGQWRYNSVKVGNHIPPDAMHIEYLMNIFFTQATRCTVTQMYRYFQTIHPFADGNGRVGGILLAVRSYLDSDGKLIIMPCQ